MKLYLKYVLVVLIFISLFLLWIPNTVNAEGFFSIIKEGSEFINKGNKEVIAASKIKETSDYIYNTLLGIGIVLAIVVGMALGIKFIIGSIDEQAKIKEALVPYIISCIIIFGAFTIWKIFVQQGDNLEEKIKTEFADTTEIEQKPSPGHGSGGSTDAPPEFTK